jgi:hypothetical protein
MEACKNHTIVACVSGFGRFQQLVVRTRTVEVENEEYILAADSTIEDRGINRSARIQR